MKSAIFAHQTTNSNIRSGFIIYDVTQLPELANSNLKFARDLREHGITINDQDFNVHHIGIPCEDHMLLTWELFTAYDIKVGSIKTLSLPAWEDEVSRIKEQSSGSLIA